MKQSSWVEIINKLNTGNTVYLINEFYNRVFKIPPDWPENYTAKKKDGREYPIKYSTDLVLETMQEAVEITEEEYLKYQA
jgi:hypothetical protein